MKAAVILLMLIVPLIALAQRDDEELPETRDERAADSAIDGWWRESMRDHDQRISWWRQARFGMFVHWGIYSLPGGEWKGRKISGYSEHLMRKEKISRVDYLSIARQFDPQKFDADQWIALAKQAGMKYFIVTAKHHDGFAMYPSSVSDFNIVQQTPFARDPMAELAQACRKYDMKFGFYYSHAFDWEHPDAPGNDWEYNNPGGDRNLFGGRTWYDQHPDLLKKARQYVDQKAIPQITELLTKYHPDILWFDTPHKLPLSENIRILRTIRAVDRNVVINGRLARSGTLCFGDYVNTADRPAEFYPVTGDWEAIPTTNESYGYHKFDSSHKTATHFIRLVASAASRGGNLLLNIGPKGDGEIAQEDQKILRETGKWFSRYGESIYGTSATTLPIQSWGTSTLKDNIVYLHVFQWPADGSLVLGGLKSRIVAARLVGTRKRLQVKRIGALDVAIRVPEKMPDPANTVIALEIDEPVVTDSIRLLAGARRYRLLAFDARQHGGGFSFGDGKAGKYYVESWSSKEQKLSWTFRMMTAATLSVRVKYVPEPGGGGRVAIQLDGTAAAEVILNGQPTAVTDALIGPLTVSAGTHTLTLSPTEVIAPGLMKLLEVEMTPTTTKPETSTRNQKPEARN